jgi:hypothetical protein
MFHDIQGILVLMQAGGLAGAGTSRRYEKKISGQHGAADPVPPA